MVAIEDAFLQQITHAVGTDSEKPFRIVRLGILRRDENCDVRATSPAVR
jgi:hypothetical protein